MSDEMLKLDELELLIREYDPEQSDWNFRRSVMMKIIDQIRPLTVRAAASAEPVAWRWRWKDNPWSFGPIDPRFSNSKSMQVDPLYTHPAPDAASDELEKARKRIATLEAERESFIAALREADLNE